MKRNLVAYATPWNDFVQLCAEAGRRLGADSVYAIPRKPGLTGPESQAPMFTARADSNRIFAADDVVAAVKLCLVSSSVLMTGRDHLHGNILCTSIESSRGGMNRTRAASAWP